MRQNSDGLVKLRCCFPFDNDTPALPPQGDCLTAGIGSFRRIPPDCCFQLRNRLQPKRVSFAMRPDLSDRRAGLKSVFRHFLLFVSLNDRYSEGVPSAGQRPWGRSVSGVAHFGAGMGEDLDVQRGSAPALAAHWVRCLDHKSNPLVSLPSQQSGVWLGSKEPFVCAFRKERCIQPGLKERRAMRVRRFQHRTGGCPLGLATERMMKCDKNGSMKLAAQVAARGIGASGAVDRAQVLTIHATRY